MPKIENPEVFVSSLDKNRLLERVTKKTVTGTELRTFELLRGLETISKQLDVIITKMGVGK